MKILIRLSFVALFLGPSIAHSQAEPLSKDERMAWWRQAEFGMFIHWGPYAVPAGFQNEQPIRGTGEWIMNVAKIPVADYEKYAEQFNPQQFDADAWVNLAKEAGMTYLVITAKHHDGFCLWPSQLTNYDFQDFTQFQRDPIKELSEACKKHDIKFGLYYSIVDWHHPQAQGYFEPDYNERAGEENSPEFQNYVDDYMKPQLKELIENYDPAILWFDGDWIKDWTRERGADIYHYALSLKPDIVINNRVGKGRDGAMDGLTKGEGHVGDFGTPEQEVPEEGLPGVDWESCITMNDTWGFKADDHNWKSVDELWKLYLDVTSKGGNLLLNVGPTKEGLIPPESIVRLKALGSKLDQANTETH